MCYHTKFGRSRSTHFDVGRLPKIWETLGPHPLLMEAWLTPKNVLPHLCYHAKFGHFRSNHTSVIMEIRQKYLTHRVPPFIVTRGHWNRHGSIGYL